MALAGYQGTFFSKNGNPIPGLSITVANSDTRVPPAIYSDSDGQNRVVSLFTDDKGFFQFFVKGGFYDITFDNDGKWQVTWTRVGIGTMQGRDYTPTPTYEQLRFTPLAEEPSSPSLGTIFMPTDSGGLGADNGWYVGPGPYVYDNISRQGESPAVFTWKPISGSGLAPTISRNSSHEIGHGDAGRLIMMGNAGAATITFEADLLRADQVATGPNTGIGFEVGIVSTGAGAVRIAAGSGVSIVSPLGPAPVTIPMNVVVPCTYVRTAPGMATVYVGGSMSSVLGDTAANWALANPTIPANAIFYNIDNADQFKFGTGANWDRTPYSQPGTAPVTVARPPLALVDGDHSLDSTNCTFGISGQELRPDRLLPVTGAIDSVNLTPAASSEVGKTWAIDVENIANTVTLKRPRWTFAKTGNLSDRSAIIAGIADKSGIANGQGISAEAGIPSGATVVDSALGADSIRISDAATADISRATLTFDAGVQGTINGIEEDVALPVGLSIVAVRRNSFGLDLSLKSESNSLVYRDETMTFDVSTEHLGCVVRCSHAETAINATFIDSFDPPVGSWLIIEWTGLATVALLESSTTIHVPRTDSLTLSGQWCRASVEYRGAGEWVATGRFAAA
jgi:hypothetical protein